MKDVETVRSYLDDAEILLTLAEEASELNHAALKLRRAITKINPTPVPVGEAQDMVITELADIANALDALRFFGATEQSLVEKEKPAKMARWADRLIKEHGEKRADSIDEFA